MGKINYDQEFKRTILELLESGKTTKALCEEFNVSQTSIHRWSKVLGSKSGEEAVDLKVVNNLVYVSGYNQPLDSAHFDTDTVVYEPYVFQEPRRKSNFLIQYDTSGVFNWLRMPGSDSVSTTSISECPDIDYWMDTQDNGEVYWLT